MPEGHTLHRLAGEIGARFARRRVGVSSPQGRFTDAAALLDGTVLRSAEAAGKHLFVQFSGQRVVHVHLGLIGSFVVSAGTAPPPRGAVRLRLTTRTAYADLRGPITCELVGPGERDALIGRLGPDPLRADAEPERAWQRISVSQVPIAALLMQQDVVAGVGNVYRAEVLFRQRIHPHTPGRAIDHDCWLRIWTDLVGLMRAGVASGRIDTVHTDHTPEAMGRHPRVDDHGGEVYVYRRAGLPCWVCGHAVRTEVLAGRNLFWCPHCQVAASTAGHRGHAGRRPRG